MRSSESLVLELAATQMGLIARRQALDLGLTRHQVDRRVRTKRWTRVDDGVYLIAGHLLTWPANLLAPCLAHATVASHRSAAALWRLPGGDRTIVEVTSWRHLRRSASDVIWHESRLLEPADVTVLDQVAVTRPTRTLLDLAAVVDGAVLEAAIDNAEARGLTSKSQLLATLHRRNMARRPGARAVLGVLERHASDGGVPMSEYETRFRQLLRNAGLPEPVAQYELRDSRGLIGRADFAYVDCRIAIEIQSYAWHAGRANLERDSRRFARMSAIGWVPLPVLTVDIVRNPTAVVQLVSDALANSCVSEPAI